MCKGGLLNFLTLVMNLCALDWECGCVSIFSNFIPADAGKIQGEEENVYLIPQLSLKGDDSPLRGRGG